jgi:hypothetical protein
MTWAKTWHRGPAAKDAIVVGHDGSSGGAHALATALELAGQVHASVVVGRAWSIATAPRPPTWKFGYVSSHLQRSRAVDVNIATFTAARRRASSPSRTRLECSFSGHVGRRLRSYGSRFRQRPVWSEPAGTSGLGRRGCRRGCRRIRAKPSVARPACRRADRHDQRV